MASYYYTCASCNASIKGWRQGNSRDADRYAKWLESQGRVCSDCWKKEQERLNTAAAADPVNDTLPMLEGSDKQVQWAARIRLETLPVLDKALNNAIEKFKEVAEKRGVSDAALAELVDGLHLIAQEYRESVDASFWIDERDTHLIDWENKIKKSLSQRVSVLCPTFVAENPPAGAKE